MEVNSVEGDSSGGAAVPVNRCYPYNNRIDSYDPNMSSTVRLSPTYNNVQNIDNSQPEVYENIILIPYHTAEINVEPTKLINNSPIPTSEMNLNSDAIPIGHRAIHAEEHRPEVARMRNNVEQDYQEIERLEHQVAQIILQRSPNGTLYQNYYVTSRVDFIKSEGNPAPAIYQEQLGDDKQSDQGGGHGDEYSYSAKLAHNGELMENLSETNFVQLEPELIAGQNQPEFLADHYNSMEANNAEIVFHEKDPQRMLLESTMSPLLAAVNDITQRDAELQSYLNQSLNNVREREFYDGNLGPNEPQRISRSLRQQQHDGNDTDEDFLFVIDKPVESRAVASLPTNYLYFGNGSDKSSDMSIISVYAKREIPSRTKFGPIEGEMRLSSDVISDILLIQASNNYPLLLVNDASILDVSNEFTSNWMRFVRLARNFSEQNLLLFEENGQLFFKTCQIIYPKQELKVGYSETYAKYYDLKVMNPTKEELRELYNREHPWPCFECDQRFESSKNLQDHLTVHDIDDAAVKPKQKRRKRKLWSHHMMDIRKNSIRCFYCNKVFMTNATLKKHIATHLQNRRAIGNKTERTFRCSICYKKFMTEERLKSHRLVHLNVAPKPYKCEQCDGYFSTPAALAAHVRSHNSRSFSCVFCLEKFTSIVEFKRHIVTHSFNGAYTCNHCKKCYTEYYLVRKHIRIFHQTMKFSCNECGRKFPNMVFLRRHKVSHSDRFEFLCSQCGKQFKRKDKLREHVQRIHSDNRKQRATITKQSSKRYQQDHLNLNDGSQYLELSPRKQSPQRQPVSHQLEDYRNFMYKCDECMLGFKRRGMLVNHMAKRHPNVSIDSIPELNLPIFKPQSLFFCQYCSKVYKSNAKRKLHILKNHPGQELPPSARTTSEPSQINARTIGNLPIEPHRCRWCYKQYVSRSRLAAHHRKEHGNVEFVSNNDWKTDQFADDDYQEINIMPSHSNAKSTQTIDVYNRPPCSPENKLLKLSSAALELSAIEDRKFFDFLNEKSQCSLHEENSIQEANHHQSHHNLSLESDGNAFSKVGVNFKVVESEFGETSSNGELNRLPQLFEESIACI